MRLLTARVDAQRAQGVGARSMWTLASRRSGLRVKRKSAEAGETLDAIIGVPRTGREELDGDIFDGLSEAARSSPADCRKTRPLYCSGEATGLGHGQSDLRFLRFRPPIVAPGQAAPQIRLDRALQFLIGDRLA